MELGHPLLRQPRVTSRRGTPPATPTHRTLWLPAAGSMSLGLQGSLAQPLLLLEGEQAPCHRPQDPQPPWSMGPQRHQAAGDRPTSRVVALPDTGVHSWCSTGARPQPVTWFHFPSWGQKAWAHRGYVQSPKPTGGTFPAFLSCRQLAGVCTCTAGQPCSVLGPGPPVSGPGTVSGERRQAEGGRRGREDRNGRGWGGGGESFTV